MARELQQAVDLNKAIGGTPADDSVHDYLERTAGEVCTKSITLTDGTAVSLFQITGAIHIHKLYGLVTEATTVDDLPACSFQLFPTGGAAIPITSAAGAAGTGVAVGSLFMRKGVATDTITVQDSALGGVVDQIYQGSDVYNQFTVIQKNGVDTFIQFISTESGGSQDVDITFYVEYNALDSGTLTAV